MAKLLWGQIYFKDQYAGQLREESGGRMVFEYDSSYLQKTAAPIAFTLPLSDKPYISAQGLHPFFDN